MGISNKITSTIKQGVLNNDKYTLNPVECPIKLNQNESPFDIAPELKEKIIKKVNDTKWNIYPDFIPESIYKKVAKSYGVKSNNILLGNGSNEMIFTILTATMEKGKKVIIPEPTFTVYKLISTNLNAEVKAVYLNKDLTFNVDNIMAETQAVGSVTILCSPNNPTGSFIKHEDIKKIVLSSNGIVVVDEAYVQFGGESVLDLINKVPNLIVLRTFSKAFGLAGLRVGIMLSNEKIIAELSKVKLPYNLNIFSLAALDSIFDNFKYVDANVKCILKERELLKNELSKFKDIKIYDTSTNFLLIKTKNSQWLYNELLQKGILIRDVSSYPMLKDYLRISVGNFQQNKELIKALNKIFV